MPVFFFPEFIVDLQNRADANFARRVLKKTLRADGSFRSDSDDHRYHGIDNAWIRYVSSGHTAYRIIYLRFGDKVYLFRAGNHSIEDHLASPDADRIETAIPVVETKPEILPATATPTAEDGHSGVQSVINRFRRNVPNPEINREIFSRRNLPHRDIWLVTPFINTDLLQPTARLGKFLFDQVEDGASISIFTSPPRDKKIEWMEKLEERRISVFVYPRLHAKLYCFVLDEDRKYEQGLPDPSTLTSLFLVGSANLTAAGFALGRGRCNEELCYVVPENERNYIETYVADLMMRAYDLKQVRIYLARGQWQKLENDQW